MKLHTAINDTRISTAVRGRYRAIVAKLDGEYLFDDERKRLFREMDALNEQATQQLRGAK